MKKILIAILLIQSLSACSTLFGDRISINKVKYNKLEGWDKDDQLEAMVAFKKTCDKYSKMPADKNIHASGTGGKYESWHKICIKTDSYDTPKQFFESNFTPYEVTNWWRSSGTFTGYFESDLNGSRTKHYPYIYPVYKTPKDLIPKTKYYSRAEIDAGALAGKGLEIAWVDDNIRLFFMQIQGSARINMDDGTIMRVGYDSQNGHKYFPIGKYLLDKGYVEKGKVSKTTIEEWLKANPKELQATLELNPSYVFFREIKGDGPIGAQGVALTPMRSLAIDKKYIPYGVPVWLDTGITGGAKGEIFRKLLIAQDTGGAIKGPVRGDIFFGNGLEAERLAGYQNNKGKYFILLPNS